MEHHDSHEGMDQASIINWRSRMKRRRGKAFNPVNLREINLVAMMDLMTVILVFLLKSYSVSALSIPVGEEMSIPVSNSVIEPEEAVKLTITKIDGNTPGIIALDETPVMNLDRKKIAELKRLPRDGQIKEIYRVLNNRAAEIQEIAKANPAVKFNGKILFIADKGTPYWLVTKLLLTSAMAGFDQYKLVAIKEAQN